MQVGQGVGEDTKEGQEDGDTRVTTMVTKATMEESNNNNIILNPTRILMTKL